MKDWNKQSDEPESSAGRILTVHLQVGELPKTSELIFWEVCVEAFICFGFHCGKMTHSFMYCIVTCASTTNIKQHTHTHTNNKKKQLNAGHLKNVFQNNEYVKKKGRI